MILLKQAIIAIVIMGAALYAAFCPWTKPRPQRSVAEPAAARRRKTAMGGRPDPDCLLGVLGLLPLEESRRGLDELALLRHDVPRDNAPRPFM